MWVIPGFEKISDDLQRSVVTIGNFDGVHRGHQEIIKLVIEKAGQFKASSIVYTFSPHPQFLLHPGRQIQLLSTYSEKLTYLEQMGVDYCVEEPFSREFSSIPAPRFFEDVLIKRLKTSAIVVGHDFGFGKNREGNLEGLRRFCDESQVELTVVPPFEENDGVVSSSRIRKAIFDGEIAKANQMLGYTFSYTGIVVRGDGRGHKIGFPTANLKTDQKIELPNGVYVTLLLVGGKELSSVTNIGIRPTFVGDQSRVVETHITQKAETIDLYGQPVRLFFFKKIRDEKKFENVDGLKKQIQMDVESAEKCRSMFHRKKIDS